MKHLLLSCALLAAGLAMTGPAFADDKKPAAEKPAVADVAFFTKVRMDYAKRADFNPAWDEEDERQAILAAYKAKQFAKVVELSKAWLDKCPVDADMHYIRSQALVETHDITQYAYELYYFYGLVQSVAASGDGLTPKTGFKVISVAEEYYLLNDFGAKVLQQSLQGNSDVMQCKLSDGKEVTYYFDASIVLAAEAKALGVKK